MVVAAHNDTCKESARIIAELSFSIGVYRPPSEGGSASLLLRVTENCPWNKCAFCDMYKDHPFVYRSAGDIKSDINTVKKISDEIKAVSEKIGQGGRITRDVGMAILRADPSLNNNQYFISVFNWLYSGGKTAFLQDADSMIMRPHELIAVLKYLREKLPSLIRVTSYARSKTLAHRKPDDLRAIQ